MSVCLDENDLNELNLNALKQICRVKNIETTSRISKQQHINLIINNRNNSRNKNSWFGVQVSIIILVIIIVAGYGIFADRIIKIQMDMKDNLNSLQIKTNERIDDILNSLQIKTNERIDDILKLMKESTIKTNERIDNILELQIETDERIDDILDTTTPKIHNNYAKIYALSVVVDRHVGFLNNNISKLSKQQQEQQQEQQYHMDILSDKIQRISDKIQRISDKIKRISDKIKREEHIILNLINKYNNKVELTNIKIKKQKIKCDGLIDEMESYDNRWFKFFDYFIDRKELENKYSDCKFKLNELYETFFILTQQKYIFDELSGFQINTKMVL